MTERIYALQHRTCGHIGVAANNRARLEHQLAHLQAAGYHQWRIRTVPADDAVKQLLDDAQCDTCRLDPQRAKMLLDGRGACRVCMRGSRPDGPVSAGPDPMAGGVS